MTSNRVMWKGKLKVDFTMGRQRKINEGHILTLCTSNHMSCVCCITCGKISRNNNNLRTSDQMIPVHLGFIEVLQINHTSPVHTDLSTNKCSLTKYEYIQYGWRNTF